MKARLKAGIPGNKITRGDFEWERALEIIQEVFVDSLHQAKQHQDFRGFGQGRGGHRYKRGQGFHRGARQDSISKHHIVRPVTDVGETTTGQGTVFYGDNHWKWHVSRGPVLGANETREFIIRSLGATRKGGGRNGNNTRVASTARCNWGELS